MRLKLPPQITRLAVLFVVIVVGYFVARHFLVPSSFGKYGWYRADSLKDNAGLPITFAGAAACAECHSDVVEEKAKSGHKPVGCESCHGPQSAHVADVTVEPAKITDGRFCVRCHAANPSRPEKFPQVNLADHFEDQKCIECHAAHNPKESK